MASIYLYPRSDPQVLTSGDAAQFPAFQLRAGDTPPENMLLYAVLGGVNSTIKTYFSADINLYPVTDDTPTYPKVIVSIPISLNTVSDPVKFQSGDIAQAPSFLIRTSEVTPADMRLYDVLDGILSTQRWYNSADIILYNVGLLGGVSWQLMLADSLAFNDAFVNNISLNKADLITLTDNLVKAIGLSKNDVITLTDNISKNISKLLSDNLSLIDNIIKNINLNKTDSISLTDDIVKVLTIINIFKKFYVNGDRNVFVQGENPDDVVIMEEEMQILLGDGSLSGIPSNDFEKVITTDDESDFTLPSKICE